MVLDLPRTRKELLGWLGENPRLAPLLAKVSGSVGDQDAAHDASHLLRVTLWTLRLAAPASQTAAEEAAAAALLHDLVNVPKNHPDRAKASTFSAEAAAPLLASAGFARDSIGKIQSAIRDHSYSRGATPESPLGRALQDADRLEALGAIGLMRVFSTGARMGTAYFDPADPWARERPLNDLAFSVDHFFTKLLKLPATFHTPAGRSEAERRAAVLETFLDQTAAEIGEPRP